MEPIIIFRIIGSIGITKRSFRLDCPHYTRPEVLEGMEVPPVLLSGNHAEIRRWRLKQSLGRTWLRRPELLENLALTEEQARLLAEFKTEHAQQQHKHDGMA